MEACWAHNPKVLGSTPTLTISYFLTAIFVFLHEGEVVGSKPTGANIYIFRPRSSVEERSITQPENSSNKRGGAVEACWAHNPKVVGSKPTLAISYLLTAILSI